jgi:malonate-semialdehyde dehydrogenase (acetylating)/methylmalonate-semialdehyde dehydrogenase
MSERQIRNYIHGQWHIASSNSRLDVINPATAQALAEVVLSPADEVAAAAEAGQAAFEEWRRVPVTQRIQPLFKLKFLLEDHLDELARIVTNECGKTYAESVGEIRRGIENIEVACGAPILMQGYNNEDIARGIDEHMIRQPLGVVAAITPFNFPAMIPLWFLPYAVATGNAFILKPSERVPMASERLFELIDQAGFPPGVLQLVNGGKETVDALLDHPLDKGVQLRRLDRGRAVHLSPRGREWQRAQCQGGAKNPVVIMPDADMDATTRIMADSAFGCAGQRCLAASVAVTVGEARTAFTERIADAAASRKVAMGWYEGIEMGPVISAASKSRIEGLIEKGQQEARACWWMAARNR